MVGDAMNQGGAVAMATGGGHPQGQWPSQGPRASGTEKVRRRRQRPGVTAALPAWATQLEGVAR